MGTYASKLRLMRNSVDWYPVDDFSGLASLPLQNLLGRYETEASLDIPSVVIKESFCYKYHLCLTASYMYSPPPLIEELLMYLRLI